LGKLSSSGYVQPVTFQVHDFPNTIGSTAYTLMWKNGGASTSYLGARNGGANTAPVTFGVQEIMG
jgi:hypothetical protein